MKKIFKIISFNILFILLALVLLELLIPVFSSSPLLKARNWRTLFSDHKIALIHSKTPITDTSIDWNLELPKEKINSRVELFEKKYNLTWSYQMSDNYTRLINPKIKNRKKTVLFLGGSFVFGHLLTEKETLPYFYQKLDQRQKVVMVAASGAAGHENLTLLLTHKLDPLLTNKNVTVIYGFIPNHLLRVTPGANPFFNFIGSKFINNQKDKTLLYEGNDNELLLSELPLYLLTNSAIFGNYLRTNSKFIYNFIDDKRFISILMTIKKYVEKRAKHSNFYLYTYCLNSSINCHLSTKQTETMSKKAGFHFIDIKKTLLEVDADKRWTVDEYHPGPATNKTLADFLFTQIQ